MTENQLELQVQLQPQSQVLTQHEIHPEFQLKTFEARPNPQDQPQAQLQAQPQILSQPEAQLQLEEEVKPKVCMRSRRLLLFLLGSSLCISILGLAFYSQQHLSTGNEHADTATLPCLSSACQEAAARMSLSIDPFTRPCDYFFFSCGSDGTSAATRGRQRGKGLPQHPQGQRQRGAVDDEQARGRKRRETDPDSSEEELTERMTDRKMALMQSLKRILELVDQSQPAGPAVQKARGFYRSCMETGSRESAGAQPFLRLIQKLGGWAVSGPWNRTDFNSTLSLLMRDYNTFPFFSLYVGKDPNDTVEGSDRRFIQIDQPDFKIPIEWSSKTQKSKTNTPILRPFLASYLKFLALLGSSSSSSDLSNDVGLFISLSSELAVAAAPLSYRQEQGLLYQRKTIGELQTLAPVIDWQGCLQAAFHPHPVSQSDRVLLHNLPYVIHMSNIIGKWLSKHEHGGSGSIHTFMVLSLLHTFIPALDSRFAETERNFSLARGHTEEEVPHWRQCVLETERGFNTVLSHLLHESTVKEEVEEMIQNIFSSLKSTLADLKWGDKESRQFVLNKVWSLTPRLSSQREVLSESELNQHFSEVTIRERDYFSNYVQSLSLQQRRRTKLLSQTGESDNLSITPYISGEDLIFPLGMFVPPLFHPTYPRALNYGVLGSLIAKDILHLLLPDIHSQSESVQTVGDCVWERYVRLTEGPGRVGAFSLSSAQQQEVWVQYSALQMAIQAYGESLKQRPGDSSFSGLSHNHLFLTSFAQINCDSDPYREFMLFEPSFLVTVICATSELCPTTMSCPEKPQQYFTETC